VRPPRIPQLGIQFYWAERTDTAAFAALVRTLLDLGARPAGCGAAHRGAGVRDRPFIGPFDSPLEPVGVSSGNLARWLEVPDVRLVQVELMGATDTNRIVSEMVTYQAISTQAVGLDHHPIGIWTDGELFWSPREKQSSFDRRAQNSGRRVHRRFVELVTRLKPSYAAITDENALPCLTDLRKGPSTSVLMDWYISEPFVGNLVLTEIKSLFAGAYQTPIAEGLYVSARSYFNKRALALDEADAISRSRAAAQMIASSARRS
jgi:hypothetical protein